MGRRDRALGWLAMSSVFYLPWEGWVGAGEQAYAASPDLTWCEEPH